MSNFLLYQLRVYDLRVVKTAGRASRVVNGYPKDKILELYDQQAEGAKDFESCINELHNRSWAELHQAIASISGLREYREQKIITDIQYPSDWIEPDATLSSGLCIWRPAREFGLKLPDYYIEATVTTATLSELKVTGLCPIEWLQTSATISSEVLRKLQPGEAFSLPNNDGKGRPVSKTRKKIYQLVVETIGCDSVVADSA